MKNNWDISVSHLLCTYECPTSLSAAFLLSWLSVVISGMGGQGDFCKLARGYLRLAAKCLADLTPQQTLGPLLELLSYSTNFQRPLRKLYDASSSAHL